MNKKEVAGTVEEINGKIAQGVGKVTGSKKIQEHGKVEVAEGKQTKAVGHVEAKVDSAKKDMKAKVHSATK